MIIENLLDKEVDRKRKERMVIGKFINLTGEVFNRLTVIEPTDQRDSAGSVKWRCKCSCGKETVVDTRSLRRGHTQSCGCLHKEHVKELHKKNKKYNVFETKGDVSIGHTTAGDTFLIDSENLDKVSKYCWHKNNEGYIVSRIGDKNVRLHRFILDVYDERIIDHKSQDRTDNRKMNLRIATKQENCFNRGVNKNSKTGVKGVYKLKNGKYVAQICKGRNIQIGTYDTLEEARQARIEKEIELFGEFAFIEQKGGDLK